MTNNNIDEIKARAGAVLDYIGALAKLGRPVADDFHKRAESGWVRYAGDFLHNEGLLPGVSFGEMTDDLKVWVALDRLKMNPPPPLPAQGALARWQDKIKIINKVGAEPKPPEERIEAFPSRESVDEFLVSGILKNEHIFLPSEDGGSVHCRFLWADDKDAQSEWERYLRDMWRPWRDRESPRRKQDDIYRKFHDMVQNSGGEDYPMEIVFGVGVAQKWENGGIAIRNLVLEQIAEVKLDDQTGRLLVYPRPGRKPAISLESFQEDGGKIKEVKDYLANNLAKDDYVLDIFDPDTFSPIIAAAHARLDPQASYEKGEGVFYRPEEKPEHLAFYPEWVVFIRRRDDAVIITETARKMKKQIDDEEDIEKLPATVVKVAVGNDGEHAAPARQPAQSDQGGDIRRRESSERPPRYLPLPYNNEQEMVVDKISDPNCAGVVVQGPPGTGKSHTIANIICHCLATGKRILVASHGIPALEVLESKIPEGIRDLAIPVLANTPDGKAKTERAIEQLLKIQGITDEYFNGAISRSEREEAAARKKIAQTEQDLMVLFGKQDECPPGFLMADEHALHGTLHPTAWLARWVGGSFMEHKWFADRPVTTEWSALLFGDDEIAQLRDVRARLANDLRHFGKTFPPSNLPHSQLVRDWHESLREAANIDAKMNAGDVWRFARTADEAVACAANVREKLLEMSAAIADAEAISWMGELSTVDGATFNQLRRDIKVLNKHREGAVRACVVDHPDKQVVVDNIHDVVKVLQVKARGGTSVRAWLSGRTRKIIGKFTTNGHPPRTEQEWGCTLDFAKWLEGCRDFTAKWNATVAVQIGNDDARAPGLDGITEWLRKTDKALAGAETMGRLSDEIKPQLAELFAGATDVDLGQDVVVRKIIQDIDDNLTKIKCEGARAAAKAADANLGNAEISEKMRAFLRDNLGAPDIDGQAVMRQWEEFAEKAALLREKRVDFEIVKEITDLIEKSGAEQWANQLRCQPPGASDDAIPANWRDAWRWGCANAWLDSMESGVKIKSLLADLREAENRRKKALGNVVALRAKRFLKIRLNHDESAAQNLQAFATAVNKSPKKGAKKWHIMQKMKMAALEQCYGVIPCWIMPSWRANEVLMPEVRAFDLVVMDEASQSDVKELLTLMRGKQVLIVGDDKQVSPSSFLDVAETEELGNQYLLSLPDSIRTLLRPEFSLYEIARFMFPLAFFTLKEHFRCAEPIISFSSRAFYNNEIVPLRVPSSTERMTPPLVDVYVRDGVRLPKNINDAEARAIVGEIEMLRNAPETCNRSVGVISLVGHAQARHIKDLLDRRLGMVSDVKCGGAATFQGSEFDIVFLSMVSSPDIQGGAQARPGNARIRQEFQQRFNVAASRARDRLYLYRSMRSEDLRNPDDMRRQLILHFQDPIPGVDARPLHELCDSDFEVEVFDRLVALGYAATPQVGSLGYKIDIVVEGADGKRLAVELDGDKYHPEHKWDKDIARQRTLERVGWHFWRCFASAYYRDRDGVFQSLLDELDARGIHTWQRDSADVTNLVEHREIDGMPEDQNSENADDADNAPDEGADDGGGDGDSGESAPVGSSPKPADKLF